MYGYTNNKNISTIDEATIDEIVISTKCEVIKEVKTTDLVDVETQPILSTPDSSNTEDCEIYSYESTENVCEEADSETLECNYDVHYDVCSSYEEVNIDDIRVDDYSDDIVDLVARTIYCEAGSCSEECQWLVGSTILNLAEDNGGVENVVSNNNIFNVSNILYTKTPSDLSYKVANRVLSGDRDYNVYAFRTDYYHDFGKPYTCIDNVYFSSY